MLKVPLSWKYPVFFQMSGFCYGYCDQFCDWWTQLSRLWMIDCFKRQITLSDDISPKKIVKIKAVTAPVTFEEIVMVMITEIILINHSMQ